MRRAALDDAERLVAEIGTTFAPLLLLDRAALARREGDDAEREGALRQAHALFDASAGEELTQRRRGRHGHGRGIPPHPCASRSLRCCVRPPANGCNASRRRSHCACRGAAVDRPQSNPRWRSRHGIESFAHLVNVPNVTIDLNGFAILGSTSREAMPSFMCSSTGPGHGISVSVVAGSTGGIAISNGGNGIDTNTNAGVCDNLVTGSGGAGIIVGANSTVADNVITDNGGPGITGDNTLVTGNNVSNNLASGLVLVSGGVRRQHVHRQRCYGQTLSRQFR